MTNQSKQAARAQLIERYSARRLNRILQIITITMIGLALALLVSNGFTSVAILFGLVTLTVAVWFVYQKKANVAAFILLINLMVMISSLVWVSGGIHDIAMLAYPILLLFAAALSNSRAFWVILCSVMLYCSAIAYFTMQGVFVENIPRVGYPQLIFVNVLLFLIGIVVYFLFRDMRYLADSLCEQNARVYEREETIVTLVNQDLLTGLPNRRYAEEYVGKFFATEHAPNEHLVILFFDLDNFKPINDSLGHSAGDILLNQLSGRLETVCEENDVICRFGGDEFLWIKIMRSDNEEELRMRVGVHAEELLVSATPSFFIMENQIDISGSIGIAISPFDGTSFDELCRSADLAMCNAKSKGRNTYSYYTKEFNRRSIDRFHLLMKMRESMRNNEFKLYYQPKCDLNTGKIVGTEALIRWPQEDGTFIGPEKFIPLAESSGLIVDIGRWVIEQACRDYLLWSKEGFGDVSVAVNVSPLQFRDGSLMRHTEYMLRNVGMPAKYLEFELTESLLITENDNIQRQIDQIHQLGIKLAIDDFGTGYSNLGYLRRFNASRVKIDKSFVSALGVSQRDEPLVKAMVQMAEGLGLMTVAEGVEDEATLTKLRSLGCTEGQGYYWSPALPLDQWMAFLHKHQS